MPNNLLDTDKNDKQVLKEKRKHERDLSDIRFVLKSPEGRRFYWKLLSTAGVFRRSFTGESESTMFNEGRRSLGLDALNDLLEAKPEVFSQMQQEYQSEIKREEKEQEDETKQNDDPLSAS